MSSLVTRLRTYRPAVAAKVPSRTLPARRKIVRPATRRYLEIVEEEATLEVPRVEEDMPSSVRPMRSCVRALIDGIHGLESAETAWGAAAMCAATIAAAAEARAVIIHLHNPRARKLRIIGAFGEGTDDLVGSFVRTPDDFVAAAVLAGGKPMAMRFDRELPRSAPRRLHHLAPRRSLFASPIIVAGVVLGLIEVIDANDRVADRVLPTCAILCESLVRALSARTTTAA